MSLERTENWWISEYNFCDEVRSRYHLPKRVLFHEATLRDGEQTPGVVFRKEDKIAIAKKLDELGVDRIEAGMPAVTQEDFDAIREICQLGLKAEIFAFCRAMVSDIDKALECGVDGVIIEAPSGLPRLLYQYRWSEEQVLEKCLTAVRYAKEKGLKVAFFPFDTTRAQLPFLKRLVTEVVEKAKPDSVAVIDTTGSALPDAIYYLVRQIKSWVDIPVEVHTHNDLGMSVATALAGVCAGAEVVHACINGLGERCGNTPLEEIVVACHALLGVETGIHYEKLTETSRFVEECAGVKLAFNKPLVGGAHYTRETGLGMDVMRREPKTLMAISPEFVGNRFRMVLGKKSGKASIEIKLDQLGKSYTEEQVSELLQRVKKLGTEKRRFLTDEEWLALVQEVIG